MLHTGRGRPYPEVRPASSAHKVRQHSDSSRLPLGLVQVTREESARDSEGPALSTSAVAAALRAANADAVFLPWEMGGRIRGERAARWRQGL
jgi:hypothetical protein